MQERKNQNAELRVHNFIKVSMYKIIHTIEHRLRRPLRAEKGLLIYRQKTIFAAQTFSQSKLSYYNNQFFAMIEKILSYTYISKPFAANSLSPFSLFSIRFHQGHALIVR